MTRETQINYGVLFFIFGLMLRLSPTLDIIHELMHYGWCNAEGIDVLSMTWSQIVYARESSLVIYGGYMSECMLYAFLVLFTYRHKIISSLFLGILIIALSRSFISLDFHEYAARTVSPKGIIRNLWLWGILSGGSLMVVLKVYFSGWICPERAKSKERR